LIPNIYHKNEKGKPPKKDLPLLKNDITTFELALKYGIHSKYPRCQIKDFKINRKNIMTIIFKNKGRHLAFSTQRIEHKI